MKKYYLLLFALVSHISFATAYYVIGSDSNNCQVHHDHHGTYVSGTDCLCMQKDRRNLQMQWVTNFGERGLSLGCYPTLTNSHTYQGSLHKGIKACEVGDHCSQFNCLQTLYYDNAEATAAKATVDGMHCVDEYGNQLDKCDQYGHCGIKG